MNKKTFYCNVELALDIIGGKWKPLVIYHIGNSGNIRYGELKRKIPNINERVLSRTLRELENHNLIERKEYNEKILRVEYCISKVGERVLPILIQLGNWGVEYNKEFDYGVVDFHNE